MKVREIQTNAEAVILDGYRVELEQGAKSWGASSPDVSGCFAVGSTREETLRLMREALAEHIALRHELGMAMPNASCVEDTRHRGVKAGFAKHLFAGGDMNALLDVSLNDVFAEYLSDTKHERGSS